MKLYKISEGIVKEMKDCKGINDCNWVDTAWVLEVSPEKALTLASRYDSGKIGYDNHVCPHCSLTHGFLS